MTACVFCGKPIEPGEPAAGRAPMAAHAACADAALADDAHWDRVAAGVPEPETGDAPPQPTERGGRAGGCLTLLLGVAIIAGATLPLIA